MARHGAAAGPPRLIVTRPAAQATRWISALADAGIDAVSLPLIDIAPPADPAPVAAAWHALPGTDWVMFVSANAVEGFFAARPPGAAWPAGLRAGATGPGTASALAAAGVGAVDLPDAAAGPGEGESGTRWDSESLWQRVAGRDWAGRRALVVRGEGGRDWLADTLRAAGAAVDFVAAYRRLAPAWTEPQQALLAAAQAEPARHAWHFSSSEALGHLTARAPEARWAAARAVCVHERVAEAARAAGFGRIEVLAPGADAAATAAELAALLAAPQAASPAASPRAGP